MAPTVRQFRVFVVRPYHDRIKQKIFTAIQAAGGQIPDGWVASDDATDAEIVASLARIVPDVLLAPFHSRTDKNGTLVNGLRTLGVLIDNYPWAGTVPVLMPLSAFGGGGYTIELPKFEGRYGRRKILVLDEEVMNEPGLERLIAAHVQRG